MLLILSENKYDDDEVYYSTDDKNFLNMLIVIQTNCVSVMDRETSGKTDSDRICSDLISRDEFEKSYDY